MKYIKKHALLHPRLPSPSVIKINKFYVTQSHTDTYMEVYIYENIKYVLLSMYMVGSYNIHYYAIFFSFFCLLTVCQVKIYI